MTLTNPWILTKKREQKPTETGGCFRISPKVCEKPSGNVRVRGSQDETEQHFFLIPGTRQPVKR